MLSQNNIFVTVSGGDLFSVDISNCSKEYIGSTGNGFGDIAFTTNGKLWGVSNGDLYSIDTLDASIQLIGAVGISSVSLVGVNDTILIAESQGGLYRINTNDASSSLIGDIGYYAHGDLVFFDGTIYMFTPFVKIGINNLFTQITSIEELDQTIPICEGAVSLNNEYFRILGFSGNGIIEVCEKFGGYKQVCSELNLNGVLGAAKLGLPLKELNSINVFTPNGDGINDLFQLTGDMNIISSFLILNRWGDEIANLSYPYTWSGQLCNGKEAVEGVYFYIVEKNIGCNRTKTQQNIIQLIR